VHVTQNAPMVRVHLRRVQGVWIARVLGSEVEVIGVDLRQVFREVRRQVAERERT